MLGVVWPWISEKPVIIPYDTIWSVRNSVTVNLRDEDVFLQVLPLQGAAVGQVWYAPLCKDWQAGVPLVFIHSQEETQTLLQFLIFYLFSNLLFA
jgi:hypothetical protein